MVLGGIMRNRAPKRKNDAKLGGKTHPVPVKYPERNDAPLHYTPHQSPHEAEGRRNQPRITSPKKTKRRQTAEHLDQAKREAEMGVLAPFTTPTSTLEDQPEIF